MATSPAVPSLKNANVISVATFNQWRSTIDYKVTLTPNQSYTMLFGADIDIYNPNDVDTKVYVNDTDVNSPTWGYYIDASAIAGFGWNESGGIIVVNLHTESQEFLIRRIFYRRSIVIPPVEE